MSGSRRLKKPLAAGIWPLAVVVYLVLLGGLLTEVLRPVLTAGSSFSLVHAQLESADDGFPRLRLEGEGLHAGLRGVLVREAWSPGFRERHILPGTHQRTLAVTDSLLLLASDDSRLTLVAREPSRAVRILGSLELEHTITDIRIWGRYALVSLTRHRGIAVVDLRRPESPVLVRMISVGGLILDMIVIGDTLIYADLYSGIYSIALQEPESQPIQREVFDSVRRLAFQEQRLAAASVDGVLRLYQVAEDGSLQSLAGLDLQKPIRDIGILDRLLLAVANDGSLYQWDLEAGPLVNVPLVSSVPGTPICLTVNRQRAEVVVSLTAAGLARLTVDEQGWLGLDGHMFWPTSFHNMYSDDNEVYAVGPDGLEVFTLERIAGQPPPDVRLLSTRPLQPLLRQGRVFGYGGHGLQDLGEGPVSMEGSQEPAGDWLVMASGQVVDFFAGRESSSPEPFATLELPGPVVSLLLIGQRLYVLMENQLQIFDVQDPRRAIRLAHLSLPGYPAQMIGVGPGLLGVAARSAGVLLLNVEDSTRPRLVAQHQAAGHLHKYFSTMAMLPVGSLLYVAQGLAGVEILDLSTPSNPRSRGRFDTPGYASSLARAGSLLLVGDGQKGGFLVDIEQPAAPRPVGSMPLPSRAVQTLVAGDRLLLGNRFGVFQMPLPQPLSELQVDSEHQAWIELPAWAGNQSLRVYLYDESGQVVSLPVATAAF